MLNIFSNIEWEKTEDLIKNIVEDFAIFNKEGVLLKGNKNIPFKSVKISDIFDGILFIPVNIQDHNLIIAAKPTISMDKSLKIIKKTMTLLNICLDKKDKYEQLKLKCIYLQSIRNIENMKDIVQVTADFLMQEFKLANCTIRLKNETFRFFTTKTSVIYDAVEEILHKQAENSKVAGKIKKISEDFLLKSIKNCKEIPSAVFFLPLQIKEGYLGTIFCYLDKIDTKKVPQAELIALEFANSLKNISELQTAKFNAKIDNLTGLRNRVGLFEYLDNIIKKNFNEKKATSLFIFDIDNFKKYNDTKGHLAGDDILRTISGQAKKMQSPAITFRYGGEEFITILDNINSISAKNVAEELRKNIETNSGLTVSIGCITCNNSSVSGKKLVEEADKALYRAKFLGKNKVIQFIIVDTSLGVVDTSHT